MMDADKGKRLVREFLETLHGGNIDGALALTTADAKLLIFNNELPDGFRMLGGMIPALFDNPPTREYTGQFVDGDTVISQVTIRGKTKGGEQYENAYLIIVKFAGDKVASMQEYMDSAYANQKFAFAQPK
jgi:ketosteroid isomerase-like protein